MISYIDIFVGGNIKKYYGIICVVVGGVLVGFVGVLVGVGIGGKEFIFIK